MLKSKYGQHNGVYRHELACTGTEAEYTIKITVAKTRILLTIVG